jgi:hypothetical protein
MTPPASTETTSQNPLERLRETPQYHWLAIVGACLVGLIAASVTWVGIFIGGALVGLLTANLKRAMLGGVGFGILVSVVWLLSLSIGGSLDGALSMGQFSAIPFVIAVSLGFLGSLLRGLV